MIQWGDVATWVEYVEPAHEHCTYHTSYDDWALLNTSPLPVYDVTLEFRLVHSSGEILLGTDSLPVLPPGRMARGLSTRIRSESDMPLAAATLRVAMQFTDSGGRRWSRTHNDVLIDHGPWQSTSPQRDTTDQSA